MTSIARNLAHINGRTAQVCRESGREPGEVTLIAVSKTFSIEDIQQAYIAGQRHFGESRLQEAKLKIEALPEDIIWHFIGHLQSNKAKKVAELFDMVHAIESESQLKEISKANRQIQGFIEVNIAKEPQKAGIWPEQLDEFAKSVLHYPQVHLTGLMTIGPITDDPELARRYFRELRNLAIQVGVEKLSMGMSQDFDVAIQEGATHVRVGSAIFGVRD
ncbi:MAG: YggS family pyridoxal phosphate-dependent enzyme [Chlorobia bacterium]|nr:YggS family pyridoxal phosphate-dependent enzyme [Fimbriimonadaceae bacterium]